MSNLTTNFNDRTVAYKQLLEDFKILLKKNGLKFTIQREVILENIPFESVVKNNKVEIVLRNDDEVERFIAFCNQIH